MDWLFDKLGNWIVTTVKQVIDQLLMWSVDITAPVNYWADPWAQRVHRLVYQVAWSLLVLRVALEALRLYVLRDASDSEISPGVLMRRTLIAAFWIAATRPAVQWLTNFAYVASRAIASQGVTIDDFTFWTGVLEQVIAANNTVGSILVYEIFLGLVAVGLVLLRLQAAVRGVELLIASVLGPLFAVSAAGNDDYLASGTLGVWWREVLVTTLNQCVQTLLLLALAQYTAASGFEFAHVLEALPILWVALRSPTILRQYAYHTGIGRAATTGVTWVAMRALAKLPF